VFRPGATVIVRERSTGNGDGSVAVTEAQGRTPPAALLPAPILPGVFLLIGVARLARGDGVGAEEAFEHAVERPMAKGPVS
jgi:hypothetical protein